MKILISVLAFMLVFTNVSNAQVLRPVGSPTVNAPARFDFEFGIRDSAKMSFIVPTFPAKYPTLIRKTVDSAFWYTNGGWSGAPWWKIIDEKDTSSMLLPYLRKTDTLTMLSKYLRKTDTANMLTPYHQAYYAASFDTTSRILTLAPITGSAPTQVTIPRGGSVNGITLLTPARSSGSNVQFINGDNGSSAGFSLNTTDSLTKMHFSDTASMLSPYSHTQAVVKYFDTATMLSDYPTTPGYGLLKSTKTLSVDTTSGYLATWALLIKKIDSLASISTGTGTVTSVSVTTANGVSGTVATATTTPAISLTLGNITPTSVLSSGTISTTTNIQGVNLTATGALTVSGSSVLAKLTAGTTVTGNLNVVGTSPQLIIDKTGGGTNSIQVNSDNSLQFNGNSVAPVIFTNNNVINYQALPAGASALSKFVGADNSSGTNSLVSRTAAQVLSDIGGASTASVALKVNISDTASMLSTYYPGLTGSNGVNITDGVKSRNISLLGITPSSVSTVGNLTVTGSSNLGYLYATNTSLGSTSTGSLSSGINTITGASPQLLINKTGGGTNSIQVNSDNSLQINGNSVNPLIVNNNNVILYQGIPAQSAQVYKFVGVDSSSGTNSLVSITAAQVRSDIGAGTGSGTVTSVSVTSANGVSGTVATATTTPAITLALGAITPSSVSVSGQATVTGNTSLGALQAGTTSTGMLSITAASPQLSINKTGGGTNSIQVNSDNSLQFNGNSVAPVIFTNNNVINYQALPAGASALSKFVGADNSSGTNSLVSRTAAQVLSDIGGASTASVALKVNISDTASMLSNLLRKTDTLTMLSGYQRKGNLPFLQGSGTVTLTCTPLTSGSITLSSNTLSYVVFGNMVFCTATITFSSISSPVGALQFSGLPYACVNSNASEGAVSAYWTNLGVVTTVIGKVVKNTSTFLLYKNLGGGGGTSFSGTDLDAASTFTVSFSYISNRSE